jgi:hypothetical protein
LLGNDAVNPWNLAEQWVPFVVASREEIVVAMDWTDFESDDQMTLAIHMVTSHGRSTPLLWKTVWKSQIAGAQTTIEELLVSRLREVVPASVRITLLADRGFGSHTLYKLLDDLGIEFVIRFRENIKVTEATGNTSTAASFVRKDGKATMLKDAAVTGHQYVLPAVVCVKAPRMKDAWCLATSVKGPASAIVKLYGRRFTIEESFRDTKDIRFGMGLSTARVSSLGRRDRLLLIGALAQAFLTLLGAAGEALGMDRMLKANTVKRRTHSLFTQGRHYYRTIPAMDDEALRPLIEKFAALVREHSFLRFTLGII